MTHLKELALSVMTLLIKMINSILCTFEHTVRSILYYGIRYILIQVGIYEFFIKKGCRYSKKDSCSTRA